jgi:hypothetical protein
MVMLRFVVYLRATMKRVSGEAFYCHQTVTDVVVGSRECFSIPRSRQAPARKGRSSAMPERGVGLTCRLPSADWSD